MREVTAPDVERPGASRVSQNNQNCTNYAMKDTRTPHDFASSFLSNSDQAAIAEAREAIRRGLVTVTTPKGRDAALDLADSVFCEKRLAQRRAETWTNPWPEFLVDVAKFSGVDALLANEGAFLIDERVYVCHEDELQRGLETGWNCVRLASIDGRARREHLRAPCVLVSPDESCFIWQPTGDLRKQRLVSFFELCGLLGEMGARLAAARGALGVAA